MADPFSIVTGVLGILGEVIKVSDIVTRVVNDFKQASKEIQCLSSEVHQLFSVVRSLDIALREQVVKDIVESDDTILDMISNLAGPLHDCRTNLTELMIRGTQLNPPDDKSYNSLRTIKWSLVTKNEVRNIQSRLEITKSTLINAQVAVSTLVALRSHALLIGKPPARKKNDAPETSMEQTKMSNVQPQDQVLDFVISLVHQTHQAISTTSFGVGPPNKIL